jgi:hypothetical protein
MSSETKSVGRLSVELVTASFVVLVQELAFIRWLPGQVRVLAYFPNLILLSAFLGLGLGCLRAGRRSLLMHWPLSLLVIAAAAAAASRVAFTAESASEHLFLLYYDLPKGAPVVQGVALPIVVSFVLSALSFVPLGQVVAERLNEFKARSTALQGYCWDILGSLLGVAVFAAASFAGAFPIVWFAAFLAAGLVFLGAAGRGRIVYLALAAAVLFVVHRSERAQFYSPYYAIAVDQRPDQPEFAVLTNGSLHQYAFLAARSDRPTAFQRTREGYHQPYRRLARPPRRALVVGAGTGNDVAVALDEGAEHVDAIEIDPVILKLGQRHPDGPYASPKVRAINTDARSFLNRTQETYDLIVFGTLDSMTRLSALSNVRLDNFVYTTECIEAARRRLTPDGGLVLYYMVPTDYIELRLTGMVTRVFGETPVVVAEDYGLFNRILLAGPAFDGQNGAGRRANAPDFLRRVSSRVELASDDWPYLYLSRRGVNGFYLKLIAIFAVLSIVGVAAVSPAMRQSLRRGRGIDWEMFLFGLGFLLLETRSVTEMNLAWGGTWLTSAVVFGSILLVILAATLVAQWRPLGYMAGMAGLTATLLIAYAVPAQLLVGSGPGAKIALSVLFVGLPIFFAASCFAVLFRDREQAATAFGWNLLGAVAGGLLEFTSMAVGLKALLLVALAAYLAALFVRIRAEARPA